MMVLHAAAFSRSDYIRPLSGRVGCETSEYIFRQIKEAMTISRKSERT